jgi:hypothetical protein
MRGKYPSQAKRDCNMRKEGLLRPAVSAHVHRCLLPLDGSATAPDRSNLGLVEGGPRGRSPYYRDEILRNGRAKALFVDRRGPRPLDRGRHAGSRRNRRHPGRSPCGLCAGFPVGKLAGEVQLASLCSTGLADSVLAKATFSNRNWTVRFGHVLGKAPSRQYGIPNDVAAKCPA